MIKDAEDIIIEDIIIEDIIIEDIIIEDIIEEEPIVEGFTTVSIEHEKPDGLVESGHDTVGIARESLIADCGWVNTTYTTIGDIIAAESPRIHKDNGYHYGSEFHNQAENAGGGVRDFVDQLQDTTVVD